MTMEELEKPMQVGWFLSLSGFFLAVGLAGCAAYETYALATRKVPTISQLTRNKIQQHPHASVGIAGAIGFFAGWLAEHFSK
jgi:hypothetical protein